MGLLEGAYEAIEDGHIVTVPILIGTGYDGGAVVGYYITAPPNSKVTISADVAVGATAEVSVTGVNVPTMPPTTIVADDVITIETPPGADQIEILFLFNGVGFDTDSGPLGSLTFTDVELNSPTIQGDILKFGVSNGVRVLNHEYAAYTYGSGDGSDVSNTSEVSSTDRYPIYGDTESIVYAKSGVISKKGNLNVGTS